MELQISVRDLSIYLLNYCIQVKMYLQYSR